MNRLCLLLPNRQKLHENKKSNFIHGDPTTGDNRLLSLTEESHADAAGTSTSTMFTGDYHFGGGDAGAGTGADTDALLTSALLTQLRDNGSPASGSQATAADAEASDVQQALKKRMFVLKELVATEESYVKDLALIVDGYMREIRDPDSEIVLPEDLRGGKERMIFGNVEAIYEWHRE